ncbi:MAG: hypothetical protein IT379_23520 [Deltaproteobacteria bacterium]|nr:hypothetical protein [Deltaproteobacteria bacterium]
MDGRASWVQDGVVLGGPTWAVVGNVADLREGTVAIRVRDANRRLVACAEVEVSSRREPRRAQPFGAFRGAWPVTAEWDQRHETLFSAWITKLFDVEPGARAGWAPLHQVLKDPARNVLHGSLGFGEDDYNVSTHDTVEIRADCADTLYALRAYFAWKMGLPFLFHHCLRGDARQGPRCIDTVTNLDPHFGDEPNPVRRFNAFMGHRIASLVHSGTTRTLPEAQSSDFYPIELTRQALRPGTVFINPYGHVLINTQWSDQEPGRPGALFAIDGHPGASVTHKAFARIWFPYMGWLRTGGFKAFRPAVYEDGSIRPMTDDEVRARPWLPVPSESQHQLSSEQWYERMAEIQNPQRVDPIDEARATVRYLHELAMQRARVIDGAPTEPVPMPQRPFTAFGASAAWRQHATPQLDLRILVTLERLDELPELAERGRHPFSRAVSDNELRTLIQTELRQHSIRYRASDGTYRRVTLAQLADRRERLAIGYDPNDCSEYRWGESTESDAFRTCSRRAPRNEWLRMQRLSSRLGIRWVPNHQ